MLSSIKHLYAEDSEICLESREAEYFSLLKNDMILSASQIVFLSVLRMGNFPVGDLKGLLDSLIFRFKPLNFA